MSDFVNIEEFVYFFVLPSPFCVLELFSEFFASFKSCLISDLDGIFGFDSIGLFLLMEAFISFSLESREELYSMFFGDMVSKQQKKIYKTKKMLYLENKKQLPYII